ncbi:cyanobactin biosynthesis system PatB/AcyB/McaB family protein [uncultured Nostoc sp.]|uniref:cyanobactin biosynthesis system PatB/AcyB/McaB family protein n=1 Tax=uncultured Nostoc sp. TaxID=340711 RepID=UPI0035C95B1E
MKLPKQSPPVKRPDLIQPHEAVDVVHGSVEELVNIRIKLLHGANFNDPAGFGYRSYNQLKTSGCGCFHAFAAGAFL